MTPEKFVTDCPCSGCTTPGPAGFKPDWRSREPSPLKSLGVDYPFRASWVDHSYRHRDAAGRWVYVCEPYYIDAECIADLFRLQSFGWDITVSAADARHYPGSTVAISFRWAVVDEHGAYVPAHGYLTR